MAVRVTAAQARRLGVDVPSSSSRTRTVARAPYHTRCRCGQAFTTQASEDRHVDLAGGHTRFELVVDYPPPP